MNGTCTRITRGVVVAAALSMGIRSQAAAPIKVMLLEGNNNHATAAAETPLLKKALEDSGLFQVTVVTVKAADTTTFKTDWNAYQVVVMNYNTGISGTPPAWPEETRRA